MRSRARGLGLAVAAVVLAAVLFVVLSDDGEDGDGSESPVATTTTSDERPAGSGEHGGGGGADRPPPLTAEIVIRGGRPAGGVQGIAVSVGDRVQLAVRSDTAGDLHTHGYEIEKPVEVGGVTTIEFIAEIEGLFEIELHAEDGTEVQLAELTVNP